MSPIMPAGFLARAAWAAHMRALTDPAAIKVAAHAVAASRTRAHEEDPTPAPPHEGEGRGGGDGEAGHRFAKDQLKALVERIERLQEEKKAIGDDIADVYREAKGNGFDTKALREVVRLRGQDVNARKEHEAILETYLFALGML